LAKAIPFAGITKLDLPPDRILKEAADKLEGVVIVGFDKDGDEYFASSYADGRTVLWLLERCKAVLLDVENHEAAAS
jgi:hypothetical protein